ncbi:nuclear pore complex protein Nup107 [Senna tora]|uniref:Nuclear pore complex protein Nup107 n=1 Tax=Senna tora TaxID=362788 RepID=A0A834SM28_9FABA|nr:nuclear pore complex protein Nup107 [Senna tora]
MLVNRWWRRRRRRRRRCTSKLASKSTTIHRILIKCLTFTFRPLQRPIRKAIPPIIFRRQLKTLARLAAEVIERVREVLQPRQLAHTRRNLAGEPVTGHIQPLQLLHPGDRLRQRSLHLVAADVEHRHLLQLPDLLRQAASQPAVHHHDLENGIEIGIEERVREWAVEGVESEVEESEGREGQDDVGEWAGEAVVAEVELVEEAEAGEGGGEGPAEAVGVEVEEGEVGEEEGEVGGEGAGEAGAVEVDAGDRGEAGVVWGRGAEHAGVGADVGPGPVGGEVGGVGGDGVVLPCLEGMVGLKESRV